MNRVEIQVEVDVRADVLDRGLLGPQLAARGSVRVHRAVHRLGLLVGPLEPARVGHDVPVGAQVDVRLGIDARLGVDDVGLVSVDVVRVLQAELDHDVLLFAQEGLPLGVAELALALGLQISRTSL